MHAKILADLVVIVSGIVVVVEKHRDSDIDDVAHWGELKLMLVPVVDHHPWCLHFPKDHTTDSRALRIAQLTSCCCLFKFAPVTQSTRRTAWTLAGSLKTNQSSKTEWCIGKYSKTPPRRRRVESCALPSRLPKKCKHNQSGVV